MSSDLADLVEATCASAVAWHLPVHAVRRRVLALLALLAVQPKKEK